MTVDNLEKVEVIDAIRKRWSPRSFAETPIEKDELRSLFEAARWAPSAHNEQPWRFIVAIKDAPDAYEKALSCLNESNRIWAKNAPVIILTFAKSFFDLDNRKNLYAWHDLALAEAGLMAQATARGLYVHPMAGISKNKIIESYAIPEGYEPVTALAVGHLGSPDDLPESLKEKETRERSRQPLDQIVFAGEWGKASF